MKELWKQLVEEFSDRAHERVQEQWKTKGLRPTSFYRNDEVDAALEDNALVELKSIQELIAHDIGFYGDNAYLMWQKRTKWSDCYREDERVEGVWIDLAHNAGLYEDRYSELRRKSSAALPFDLERAKRGDVVECSYNIAGTNWRVDDYSGETNISELFCFIGLEGRKMYHWVDDLRMKYPPKQDS